MSQFAQALDANYFQHSAVCTVRSECQISVDSTILIRDSSWEFTEK